MPATTPGTKNFPDAVHFRMKTPIRKLSNKWETVLHEQGDFYTLLIQAAKVEIFKGGPPDEPEGDPRTGSPTPQFKAERAAKRSWSDEQQEYSAARAIYRRQKAQRGPSELQPPGPVAPSAWESGYLFKETIISLATVHKLTEKMDLNLKNSAELEAARVLALLLQGETTTDYYMASRAHNAY